MFEKVVVTIHGVNPDRKWQADARRVLEPHFRCVNLDYHHYDGLRGPLRAVFSLWCGIPLIVAGGVAIWFALASRWLPATVAGIVVAISFGGGLLLARRQRYRCTDLVKADLTSQLPVATPSPPHVVAHSLGTFVAAYALRKFQPLRYDRVVLVGSVLRPDFDWRTLFSLRGAFREIRNELGASDWVVKLARVVGPLVRDLGGAGVLGFRSGHGFIHRISGPMEACPDCVASAAPVHNVHLGRQYGHSAAFLGPDHARDLWLPFLWGYCPKEFEEYKDLCCSVAYCRANHLYEEHATLEAALRRRAWTWFRGTIEDAARRHLEKRPGEPPAAAEQVLAEAPFLAAVALADALAETDLSDDRDESVMRALEPRIGLARALERALRNVS